MKIALFGGSFNPSHIGHQLVMTQAFELAPIETIWLLPLYQHVFAKHSDLAPVKHRLAMAKMLENHQIHTETCEIDQKMSGQTIEPVRYLLKKYPQHQFSFLMGSDQLKSFNRWGSWQTLLKLIPFYIYPRAGFPLRPLYSSMTPLTHPLQIITNISSTMVRKRLQAGLTIKHLVPQNVRQYLKKNKLYL
jgi:nicotinate-nucleotide adenylyltransferase